VLPGGGSACRDVRFSLTVETFALGMSAIAAPVRRAGRSTVGVISIAGPYFRFTEERMLSLGPALLAAANELAATSSASPLMRSRGPAAGELHLIAAS
jgi:DNA-binding IclR family transcriptional regulator